VKKLILSLSIVFTLVSCLNHPEYPEDKSSVTALVYGDDIFIAGFGWGKMSISRNGNDWNLIKNPFESTTTVKIGI